MKLKSKSSKKKILFVVSGIVLVLAVAAGGYVIYNANKSTNQTTEDTAEFQDANPIDAQSQEKQRSYNEERKEEIAENQDNNGPDSTLDVTFTSVSQMNSSIRVRAEINALIENGTCTLTLAKGGTSVTKTAATYPTANVSTCQGFDIATSELSPGTWNVTLEVTKDDRAGRATTTVDVS